MLPGSSSPRRRKKGHRGPPAERRHAPVLEVQARGVRVCGEAQTQDSLGVVARREHQQQIARWQGVDVAQLGAGQQGVQLADQLSDLARVEAQESSSWTL